MRPTFLMAAGCLVLLVTGCASDPGSMDQSEIEAKLQEALDLETVALKELPEGGYAGTGVRADGTNYAITVTQQKADQSLWYSARSEQGELKAGGFKEFGPRWLRPLGQARNVVIILLVLFVTIGFGIVVARKLARRTSHGT